MRKIISIILVIVSLFASSATIVYANDIEHSVSETYAYTEYYEDGSYITTTVKQSPVGRATTYNVTGEKIVNLYNSSDELQWTYKLIGNYYVVEGESVVCTSSTYSSVIYDKHWSLTAHNNSYAGNMAYGTATYKKKVLFITTNTHDVKLELGCDLYGNVG